MLQYTDCHIQLSGFIANEYISQLKLLKYMRQHSGQLYVIHASQHLV